MQVGGVIGDDVDDHLEFDGVRGGDQRVEVVQRAELGGDVAVVRDVISAIGQRRRIERAQPDRVDAQPGQVADPAR